MRRRGPSWELRVYLGHHPVTGAKRYATRSVRGPRADAERILRHMASAAEAGATHRAGATFRELCETWLTHAQVQLAANTVAETRRHLDRHLLPALGDVPLAARAFAAVPDRSVTARHVSAAAALSFRRVSVG